jgi:hypothetical protein
MQRLPWLGAVVLAGVAGLLVGLLLAPRGPTRTMPLPAPQASEHAPAAREQPRAPEFHSPVDATPDAEGGVSPVEVSATASPVAEAAPAEAPVLQSLRQAWREAARAALWGQVTTLLGEPIPGVAIYWSGSTPVTSSGLGAAIEQWQQEHAGAWQGLTPEGRDSVLARLNAEFLQPFHGATTDADGQYRIEGVPERTHLRVEPRLDGYIFEPAGGRYQTWPNRPLDFLGRRAWEVRARAQYDDGSFPPLVTFSVLYPENSAQGWLRSRDGAPVTLRVAEGTTLLRVMVDGYAEEVEYAVEASAASPPTDVMVRLRRGHTVSGRIQTTGELTGSYRVAQLLPLDPSAQVDPQTLGNWVPGLRHAEADDEGHYRFTGLAPGRYVIFVFNDMPGTVWEEIRVADDLTGVDFEIDNSGATTFAKNVLVRLVGSGGENIPNPRFEVTDSSSPPRQVSMRHQQHEPYAWRLTASDLTGFVAPFTITLAHAHLRASARVEEFDGREVQLRFASIGAIVARLPAGHRLPVFQCTVSVRPLTADGRRVTLGRNNSSPNGLWHGRVTEAGEYEVELTVGNSPMVVAARERVHVVEGQDTMLVFNLPEFHSVTVHWPQDLAATRISFREEAPGRESTQSLQVQRGHSRTLEYLPPGAYSIRYRVGDQDRSIPIFIPGTREITLQ